jgi:hypothetical protein
MNLSLGLGLLALSLPAMPDDLLVLDEDVRGVVAGAWALALAEQGSSFDTELAFTSFFADAAVLASGGGDPGAEFAATAVSRVDFGFVTTLPRAFTLNVTITGEGDARGARVRLTGTDGVSLDIDWTHIERDGVFVVDGIMPPAFNVTLFACLEATTDDEEAPGESSAAMALSFSTRLAADLDDDGDIDGDDLGQLLAEWGTCRGCQGDLDGDGIVGGGDMGWFLASWATSG